MNRDYWDDEIRNLKDRIEALEALLEQRDAFIVSKDLWFEFVDGLTLAGEKKDDAR